MVAPQGPAWPLALGAELGEGAFLPGVPAARWSRPFPTPESAPLKTGVNFQGFESESLHVGAESIDSQASPLAESSRFPPKHRVP